MQAVPLLAQHPGGVTVVQIADDNELRNEMIHSSSVFAAVFVD